MARPRKSMTVSSRKVSKKDRIDRQKQEKSLKLSRDSLSPPMWLDTQAKKEFKRVVEAAGEIELLDNLDYSILVVYANAYSHFTECCKKINELGELADRETRYGTHQVVSPYVRAQSEYAKQIMQCSSKLGLATTDRLRLIVPTKEEVQENKFLKYLVK